MPTTENRVYKYLHGRDGNFLFQTTCGMYYAKEHDMLYKSVILTNLQDYLMVKDYLFPGIEFVVGRPDSRNYVNTPDEVPTKYTPIPFFKGKDIVIVGCRESSRYSTKEFVLGLYRRFLDNIGDEAYGLYGDLSRTISVNIRRGDKLSLEDQYFIPSKEYILDALSMLDDSMRVIFTSDDLQWCKDNFKGDRYMFADMTSEAGTPKSILDLRIQSMCAHNVISNSTFSWWGAYLNENEGRKVLFRRPWYKKLPDNDVIPENDNWIEIPEKL